MILKTICFPSAIIWGLLTLPAFISYGAESTYNNDERDSQETCIQTLPQEIIATIVEEVILSEQDKKRCVKNLASVCKNWNTIVKKLGNDFFYKIKYGILGHEAVYQRFLNGALIYKPNEKNDVGKIVLPIRNLTNPLEGTFDLSQCEYKGRYLSISTGYRKGKNPANANKLEIWFAPRFLIERELNGTAKHFKDILPAEWSTSAEVGIFWNWGGYDDMERYYYLTTRSMGEISDNTLYEKLQHARISGHAMGTLLFAFGPPTIRYSCFFE